MSSKPCQLAFWYHTVVVGTLLLNPSILGVILFAWNQSSSSSLRRHHWLELKVWFSAGPLSVSFQFCASEKSHSQAGSASSMHWICFQVSYISGGYPWPCLEVLHIWLEFLKMYFFPKSCHFFQLWRLFLGTFCDGSLALIGFPGQTCLPHPRKLIFRHPTSS